MRGKGLFERELRELSRQNGYSPDDLARLIKSRDSQLNDEAQWVRLVAVQAGIEFIARMEAADERKA